MSSNLNKVILVDKQLEDYFLKVQNKELDKISLFKVIINENTLQLDCFNEGPIPGDFEQVNNALQPKEPCYFLLKQSSISWSLISWLPEGHVKIRDRMKYATGRNTLKEAFSHKLITNDYHFTQLNEFKITKAKLTANNPKRLAEERRAVMTPFEIIREEVKEQQKVTRDQQMEELKARAQRAEKTSLNHFISGGFHQVQIPLNNNFKQLIPKLQADELGWIELKVTDSKDSIDVEKSLSFNEIDIESSHSRLPITDYNQPRFFLLKVPNPDYKEPSPVRSYPVTPVEDSPQEDSTNGNKEESNEEEQQDDQYTNSFSEKVKINESDEDQAIDHQNGGQEGEKEEEEEGEPISVKDRIKKLHSNRSFEAPSPVPQSSENSLKHFTVLIYYCPSNSPPRLRMVYSTCSGGIIQQLDDLQLVINFKVDQFDPFDTKATLKQIHDKVYNYQNQANVTKLGKELNLTKLISNSHYQSQVDEKESQIKAPKFSQLKRTGHPVFGQLPQ